MDVGIVTGAASGLGRAFSARLLRLCDSTILIDLDERGLARQKAAVGPDRVLAALAGDVADEDLWTRTVGLVREHNASVSWLVNCAGVGVTGAAERTSLDDWRWVLETNLLGAVASCRAFVPVLKEQRFGHIVNIASAAAFIGSPSGSAYCTSKAALVAFSETLYNELFRSGITVTVVCPSFFPSNLVSTLRAPDPADREVVTELMRRSTDTADRIAAEALDHGRRGLLYDVSKGQARLIWRLKRVAPYTALRLVRRHYADIKRDMENRRIY